MKNKRVLASFLIVLLTSCSSNVNPIESEFFCFSTYVNTSLYDGQKSDITAVESILTKYDKLADNYRARDVNNLYTINNTNEPVSIDSDLYNMLKKAFEVTTQGANNYNPLCGSLAKQWKTSLLNKQVLSDDVIAAELAKIQTSNLTFLDNNTVQRTGEAELDLGGIAKGYALDEIKTYFTTNDLKSYLVNGGQSSILLGEKKTKDGLFNVGFKEINNAYIKVKNCFVSTSGISEQFVEINGVKYSHIVDPKTGKANYEHDMVIVISETGYYGDALSTSMMMNTIDEIKNIEKEHGVKAIVIKDKRITYQNDSLEVFYH